MGFLSGLGSAFKTIGSGIKRGAVTAEQAVTAPFRPQQRQPWDESPPNMSGGFDPSGMGGGQNPVMTGQSNPAFSQKMLSAYNSTTDEGSDPRLGKKGIPAPASSSMPEDMPDKLRAALNYSQPQPEDPYDAEREHISDYLRERERTGEGSMHPGIGEMNVNQPQGMTASTGHREKITGKQRLIEALKDAGTGALLGMGQGGLGGAVGGALAGGIGGAVKPQNGAQFRYNVLERPRVDAEEARRRQNEAYTQSQEDRARNIQNQTEDRAQKGKLNEAQIKHMDAQTAALLGGDPRNWKKEVTLSPEGKPVIKYTNLKTGEVRGGDEVDAALALKNDQAQNAEQGRNDRSQASIQSREKIVDKQQAGANARTGMQQSGANSRTAQTQAGANSRSAATIEARTTTKGKGGGKTFDDMDMTAWAAMTKDPKTGQPISLDEARRQMEAMGRAYDPNKRKK